MEQLKKKRDTLIHVLYLQRLNDQYTCACMSIYHDYGIGYYNSWCNCCSQAITQDLCLVLGCDKRSYD